jgi:membrane protease YdiL (CAAX protease family)
LALGAAPDRGRPVTEAGRVLALDSKREATSWTVLGALGKAALIMLVHPVWSFLAHLNVVFHPGLPWTPPLMLLLLLLLFGYLDGRLGPQGTRADRKRLLQWRWPVPRVRGWAAAATLTSMAAFFLINTHSWTLTDAVGSLATDGMTDLPVWTGLSIALVTSAVAAFVEEAAFRGYMQTDLATRFGFPATASLVAVAFAAFHLYGRSLGQWTAGLGDWLAISLVFSALVWLTHSLLPALVGHFVLDAALFGLAWGEDPLAPLRRAALGMPFSVGAVCLALLVLAAGGAFWKLWRCAVAQDAAATG